MELCRGDRRNSKGIQVKMNKKQKRKILDYIRSASRVDKGRSKYPAMVNTYGFVRKPKGDGKIRDKHYNIMKPDKENRRSKKWKN